MAYWSPCESQWVHGEELSGCALPLLCSRVRRSPHGLPVLWSQLWALLDERGGAVTQLNGLLLFQVEAYHMTQGVLHCE